MLSIVEQLLLVHQLQTHVIEHFVFSVTNTDGVSTYSKIAGKGFAGRLIRVRVRTAQVFKLTRHDIVIQDNSTPKS